MKVPEWPSDEVLLAQRLYFQKMNEAGFFYRLRRIILMGLS